jgi:hypothetical protein
MMEIARAVQSPRNEADICRVPHSLKEKVEMISFTTSRSVYGLLVPAQLGLAVSSLFCRAQEHGGVAEINQRLLVFSTATGDVVASNYLPQLVLR